MALLMLLSSTGFSMDVHYCQGQIKSIGLFTKAASCHKKQGLPQCHTTKKSCHKKQNNTKDNCCHNQTLSIEKSDLDATPAQGTELTDVSLDFAVAFVAAFVIPVDKTHIQPAFPFYIPPLPDRDILILYQTFRI